MAKMTYLGLSLGVTTTILLLSLLPGQEKISEKIDTRDLIKEREIILAEKADLKRQWDDLNSFQAELEQRVAVLAQEKLALAKKEEVFLKRLETEAVNRQTIESYESVDPEQAAVLMISLFKQDERLATLVMRKLAAKKAGKILEAMIPLDRDLSTRLAQKTLTFYNEK